MNEKIDQELRDEKNQEMVNEYTQAQFDEDINQYVIDNEYDLMKEFCDSRNDEFREYCKDAYSNVCDEKN